MLRKFVPVLVVTWMFGMSCGGCGDEPPQHTDDAGVSDAGDVGEDLGADSDASSTDQGPADMTDDVTNLSDADVGVDMALDAFVDPSSSSGTRLRRRYLDGGDGATMTIDFWDTELQTPCTFRETEDDAIRCVPSPRSRAGFLDAGCSQPAVFVSEERDCLDQEIWGLVAGVFHRATGPITVERDIYVEIDGVCTVNGSGLAYEAETHPLTDFVRGELANELRTDDLVVRVVEGEDGSRIPWDVVHRVYSYPCRFDDAQRCLPEAFGSLYGDSNCQDLLVQSTSDGSILAAYGAVEGCVSATDRYFEKGAPFSGSNFYRLDATFGCVPTPGASRMYHVGAEILPGELPRAAIETSGSGDTFRALRRVDSDGQWLGTTHAFWDVSNDAACQPYSVGPAADVTCLFDTTNTNRFADAACTRPAGGLACEGAPRYFVSSRLRCDLPFFALEQVHEVGERVGFAFGPTAASCDLIDDPPPTYRQGADITDTLPQLQVVVEEAP